MKQKDETIQDLKDAFEARKYFFTNRSSCIFPVHLRPRTDLHIVYLNYWLLKNGIPTESLIINFRIFDENGFLALLETKKHIKNHNQVSIKELFSSSRKFNVDNFDGMVEVEIISTENIKFSFPGIVGIFQAGNLYSLVHSAGRIKNPDELQKKIYTQESNWKCKFDEQITPFFHYFCGPTIPEKEYINVVLRSGNGSPITQKEISISHIPPFGSKLFFISEIFECSNIQKDCFVSVTIEHNSIFPRMIVGNYFKDCNFLEVTHSFPIIEKIDHCIVDEKDSFQSMLNAYTSRDLALKVHTFPTNCKGDFSGRLMHQIFGSTKLTEKVSDVKFNDKKSSGLISYNLEPNEQFISLQMSGHYVPSRFNASYQYSVKNIQTKYSTDIADGADGSVYPPKYRHWGHALIDQNYDTVILIRNNTHNPKKTSSSNGILRFYANEYEKSINVFVESESSKAINVSEFVEFKNKSENSTPRFISWILEMEEPSCEVFYVGYRKTDGAIFGDHAF